MQPSNSREQLEALLAAGLNATSIARTEFIHDVMGFVHAIDWSERWLLGLAAFHCWTWIVAIMLRSADAQMVLLIALLGAVYSAEWLNTFAREHWQEFAGQNYFDKRGVFISVMYSMPLLCLAFFVLISGLRNAGKLLVKVKRKELRQKQKEKQKEKES